MFLWPLEGRKRHRMPESCHLLCMVWTVPPAYAASILPLSLYQSLETSDYCRYSPFSSCCSSTKAVILLTTPMCWGCCGTEGKMRYFLIADRVYVVTFRWIRVDIMQWLVLVVKCSHSQVPLSVLDRSLDVPFHESWDTHFTSWEDRIKNNIKHKSVFIYCSCTWFFLNVQRLWFHSLAE